MLPQVLHYTLAMWHLPHSEGFRTPMRRQPTNSNHSGRCGGANHVRQLEQGRFITVIGVKADSVHLHPAKATKTRIFDALQQALLVRRNSIFNAAIEELIARFAQEGRNQTHSLVDGQAEVKCRDERGSLLHG